MRKNHRKLEKKKKKDNKKFLIKGRIKITYENYNKER